MKQFIVILTLILFILLCSSCSDQIIKAKVIDLELFNDDMFYEYHMDVEVLNGKYIGQAMSVDFIPAKFSQFDFHPKLNDTLIISLNENDGIVNASVVGLYRQRILNVLFLIFFILLALFGQKKGILSLIALAVSGLIILSLFIPLALDGHNIISLTIVTTVIIITISFIIISGFTRKSTASILGTSAGVISAMIIAYVFTKLCAITGTVSDEAYLLICENGLEIDFTGLFISGIIIGSIGVVMDVSMSITSTIFEFKAHAPNTSFTKLVSIGLNIGKDIMATMINTLILAYVGTSMPLLFFYFVKNSSPQFLINTEVISGEIIRSLAGSIGLILTIPLTTIIASCMVTKNTVNKI